MPVTVDFTTGRLNGSAVAESSRNLADLAGVFLDEAARQALPPNQLAYRVQLYLPVPEGTQGGLFWGNTFIEPGLVGDEYFMTKGHFHAQRDRAEYYTTVQGHGALILMDEAGHTWHEVMHPGSVHYIPGRTAHRVANTGDTVLSFLACWPSDAGHDYETIVNQGFGARMRAVNGKPELIPN
ncbi:glucose-6-phosphate isomerase family protein [Hymenobacter terrenus]|uniref:glucose-6-phosphate isomerase family protein n=1 Tax=Hymenobacter terrenus TaxID=1629124 RepID=UPI000619DF8E|nr:glucose-6-phosphate isomerase family protein [Hymenobacter terrenus]